MDVGRLAALLAVATLALGTTAGCGGGDAPTGGPSDTGSTAGATTVETESPGAETYVVSGYPIDAVPLFEVTSVESSKFFVNTDPVNVSAFGDTEFAYYNVVFSTGASAEELLAHYGSLFDPAVEVEPGATSVQGELAGYRVSVSHYGSGDTAYLQAFLPAGQVDADDPHFSDFPALFEPTDQLVRHESSYGLLNQSGGQVEFARYYTVEGATPAVFGDLESHYETAYGDRGDYAFDAETHLMSWTDEEHSVTVAFAADQGRVFVQIRRPMT